MNENITQVGFRQILNRINSNSNLRVIRKMLQIFGLLLIITACIDYYSKGFSLVTAGELALAGLMMNFAQRIEIILLKKKVNAWLLREQSMNIVDSQE